MRTPESLAKRIQELRSLEDGWYDGDCLKIANAIFDQSLPLAVSGLQRRGLDFTLGPGFEGELDIEGPFGVERGITLLPDGIHFQDIYDRGDRVQDVAKGLDAALDEWAAWVARMDDSGK